MQTFIQERIKRLYRKYPKGNVIIKTFEDNKSMIFFNNTFICTELNLNLDEFHSWLYTIKREAERENNGER